MNRTGKPRWCFAEGLRTDIVFSLRMLMRNRMFSAAAIVTLALGIGTTTAVFSVIDATLLRPLPYHEPSWLTLLAVYITSEWNGDSSTLIVPSQIELVRWRAAHSFESMEASEPRLIALSGSGDPTVVNGAAISSG